MIFTECPECDEPFSVFLDDDHLLEWQRVECKSCGAFCYVEHRRFGGRTLNSEAFADLVARSQTEPKGMVP